MDPDDKTPLAIKNTGAEMISYGSPVLPGAMFLLSYYRKGDKVIPICGLPGCAMYNRRTIFDLVLPRLMAADPVTADELASLGEGGLCLNCKVCTFPNCGFGKLVEDAGSVREKDRIYADFSHKQLQSSVQLLYAGEADFRCTFLSDESGSKMRGKCRFSWHHAFG